MNRSSYLHAVVVAAAIITAGGCAGTRPPAATEPGKGQTAGEKDIRSIVVARVNGSAITMDRVVRMMNRIGPVKDGGGNDQLETTRHMALEQLILQELALQQAKRLDIGPEVSDIDAAVGALKENLGGEQAFRDFLAGQNVTEADVHADAERGLTLNRIFDLEVIKKAVVPEDVLKEEYEREKHRYVVPEKITATDVYFVKKGDKKPSLERAKEIRQRIYHDAARDPWKLVLDGTFLVRTIELNREKHPELYAAAKTMQPGDLSPVITAGDGLHVMVLKSASPERQLGFDEVRPSLEKKHLVAARQERVREWERELKQDAVIEFVKKEMHTSAGQESAKNPEQTE